MMNKEKILRALELADSIMDYCGGDAWERECTKDDRNEFGKLYEEIKKELIKTNIAMTPAKIKENGKERKGNILK